MSVLLNTTTVGAMTPSFAAQVPFTIGTGPSFVATADLNGDGKPDVATANQGGNNVSVLLNTTTVGAMTPSFTTQVAFGVGAAPQGLAAADLNGDGKPDLATANNGATTVSVLPNTTAVGATTPTFATQMTYDAGSEPSSVAAADLNSDSKPDLAVTNSQFAGTVSVLLRKPSGSFQFSASGVSVAEGGGTATVTLSRTGGTDGQVSAIVSVTGGTATQGQDYTLAGPQTVTWADGDGANKTVSIPITQDQVDEGDETILLGLTLTAPPVGATLGAQTTATVTIVDDDPVALGIANVSQAEGNSGASFAVFTVTKTGSTVRTITVQYTTADGSAQAGSDYLATSGILTFQPGDTSKTISVPILGDTVAEPDRDVLP